jgi:hypothetical protein
MYAAATSGWSDLAVIVNGRLSPPSACAEPPSSRGGTSMKPSLSPMRSVRSRSSQVPAIRNGPAPFANCAYAGS